MSILRYANVTIEYGGAVAAEDCSLNITAGEYVCLVGPNGSGKSSLIRAALGLVKVKHGEIILGVGQSEVAYLPQIDLAPLGFPATVRETVLCGTQKPDVKRLPFYSKEDKRRASEAMERMKISSLAFSRVGELSGGQRQRVFLARALCRAPKLLLLDEPCAGLDETSAAGLYDTLSELHNEGITLLMATHDLGILSSLPVRIAELNGTIIFDGDYLGWKARENRKD